MLLIAGCATWTETVPPEPARPDHLQFLAEAMTAAPSERESLWQTVEKEERAPESDLRRALMQTIPGHTGYHPAAALAALEKLTHSNAPEDVALLARVRLHELQSAMACSDEVRMLRKRLAAVADIERELDRTEP